jgi:hypothetical protein
VWLQRREGLKLVLLTATLLGLAWGGGGLTYVLRSADYWYWPNHVVRTANHAAKQALGPITPGYRTPTLFLR